MSAFLKLGSQFLSYMLQIKFYEKKYEKFMENILEIYIPAEVELPSKLHTIGLYLIL